MCLGFSGEEAELAGAVARLDPRAAVELAEQVADVHVDGALADEELLGDLAVGAADGDVAQDLELAAGQLDAVGRRGGAAAEPLGDRLAHLGDLFAPRRPPAAGHRAWSAQR